MKKLRVFVAGSTGFLGKYVIRELLKKKYAVRALVRPGSEHQLDGLPVEHAFGDITDTVSLDVGMRGCDVVINLVGIIREFPKRGVTYQRLHVDGTKTLLELAKKHKISRFLQMSSLGTRPSATTQYYRTKYQGERLVIESGLKYTIFRPSMMFGKEDSSFNIIAMFIKTTGTATIYGDGDYRVQPVYVEDVAKVVANAIGEKKAIGKVYDLGGLRTYTYRHITETIADAARHRVSVFHFPLWLGRWVARIFERFSSFPLTSEALEMLVEGNVTDDMTAWKELKIKPRQFEDVAPEYLS